MAAGFFSLPLELREMVYEYFVPCKPGKRGGPPRAAAGKGPVGVVTLLQLNRQIYLEARDVLYKKSGPLVIKLDTWDHMIHMGKYILFPSQWHAAVVKSTWFHALAAVRIEVVLGGCPLYNTMVPYEQQDKHNYDGRFKYCLLGNLLMIVESLKNARTTPPALEIVITGAIRHTFTHGVLASAVEKIIRPFRELRGIRNGGVRVFVDVGSRCCCHTPYHRHSDPQYIRYRHFQPLMAQCPGHITTAGLLQDSNTATVFAELLGKVREETAGAAPHTPAPHEHRLVLQLHEEYGKEQRRVEQLISMDIEFGHWLLDELRPLVETVGSLVARRARLVTDMYGGAMGLGAISQRNTWRSRMGLDA